MEKTFNNAHLINVKDKIKNISDKVKLIVERTNLILNTSSEFGHRFMETTDRFLNDYSSNQDLILGNESDLMKKNLEFKVEFDKCTSEFLRPIVRKDVSVLYDFNLNKNTHLDISSYENLVKTTGKLNKNLTDLLTLISLKMDPYFSQTFIKYTSEQCVLKINNNHLISETNIIAKPIYSPGYSWDIFSAINIVRDITNSKSFAENKKKYIAEVIPAYIEGKKNGELYKKFWDNLTISKAQFFLNTHFYLTSHSVIKKQANYLIEDLKYLNSLLKFINGEDKALSFSNDIDVLSEFDFVMDQITTNSFFNNDFKYDNTLNYSILPITHLKDQIFSNQLNAEGPSKKKRKIPQYLKQSHNHYRSFSGLEPVDINGNLLASNETDKRIDMEKLKEYSELISKVYAPFGKLINNPDFKIYSHDYQFYKTYNFETNTFSKFLEQITNFQTYWSLIARIFDMDTIKEFNETFLNSMCYDLTKSVFIVSNAIILKSNLQSNSGDDETKNVTLKNILENNPKLFPLAFSIREAASVSSYLADHHKNEDYEMSTIVNEFIYDSILLAPHVQITIMYCYGYFLKYLAFMSSNGLDRTTLENFELPINMDDNSFDFHYTVNSSDSLNCKNIYAYCLKLLTSSNTQDGKSLNQEGEFTLVVFILNKFMDFIYRALKINRFCEKEKNMTNISVELEEELKSSGHFTINNLNDFEKYLETFIRSAKLTVNSLAINIFNYSSVAHENNYLFLSKLQIRDLAQICLNKTTVNELYNKQTFFNINDSILVFLYSSFKAQNNFQENQPIGYGPDDLKEKNSFDMYNSVPSMDDYLNKFKNPK